MFVFVFARSLSLPHSPQAEPDLDIPQLKPVHLTSRGPLPTQNLALLLQPACFRASCFASVDCFLRSFLRRPCLLLLWVGPQGRKRSPPPPTIRYIFLLHLYINIKEYSFLLLYVFVYSFFQQKRKKMQSNRGNGCQGQATFFDAVHRGLNTASMCFSLLVLFQENPKPAKNAPRHGTKFATLGRGPHPIDQRQPSTLHPPPQGAA